MESLLWASALLLSPESADRVGSTVIIGASGGLYGLLAAFGMLYAESRVHVFMVFPLKAKYFVMILMGIEIASVLFLSAMVGAVVLGKRDKDLKVIHQ